MGVDKAERWEWFKLWTWALIDALSQGVPRGFYPRLFGKVVVAGTGETPTVRIHLILCGVVQGRGGNESERRRGMSSEKSETVRTESERKLETRTGAPFFL